MLSRRLELERAGASRRENKKEIRLCVPSSAYYVPCSLLKAAFMATPAHPAAGPGIPDLASRIYVELIGRAFLRADNVAVIKPDPVELAKLSLQLADTFRKVEKVFNAAAGPQNVGYNVDLADMAKWDK
jgi:hypothetical protein